MGWRIIWGIFGIIAFIAWGFALFGSFELGNNALTYWLALALAILYTDKAFKKD